MILLQNALLCENCTHVIDTMEVKGEQCPKCASTGSLLSLARVLNPSPTLGQITFIYSAGRA